MLPFHSGSRITEANEKEYHYECFCCEKCAQPINGTFTVNSDGSKFKVCIFFETSKRILFSRILVWKLSSTNVYFIDETMFGMWTTY
jgi:hypothetical protein